MLQTAAIVYCDVGQPELCTILLFSFEKSTPVTRGANLYITFELFELLYCSLGFQLGFQADVPSA